MKEQYIRQVEKELKVPRNRKREILRDLQEAFASALEHGETEAQVIQRLGTPKEFANSTAEQLGVDPVRGKKRKQLLAGLLCLCLLYTSYIALAAVIFGRYKPTGIMAAAMIFMGGNVLANILMVNGSNIPYNFLTCLLYTSRCV